MAAAPGLLFWLLLLGPPWWLPAQPNLSPGRRFSEHKLCADEECSMLMYRGEALDDFTGPDCRFVNFKKGDPVYVYYKLAGKSPEVWAGSVGRIFGYFPKDLIQVVHEYTKEELQLPTDETDFVCFDGGRDDFDNYNIEELLGSWELYDSATGDSERATEQTSEHMKKPHEVSEESDPEPEPKEANLEEGESLFSEDTEDLEERFEVGKNHPHANGQTDNAQGEQSSFDPFEEMLQEKLKVPESENNKTSNGSQVSSEQEKIDAYTLLKKEMTLDLKTKFGSTADAFVSDDESTRLVTSLEDDFDEELDAEYYTVGKEDEDSKENFDEIPLLTFTDGEDTKTPVKSEVEKYSTDKHQKSNEENMIEVAQPPGIKDDDKNIIATLGDTIFSIVTGSEEKTGTMDLESSNSAEEKEDDVLVPDSKRGEAQSAIDSVDPEEAEDGLLIVEIPKTNDDEDPEMDTELDIKEKGRKVQESKRGLVQDETELEDKKQEETTVPVTTQSSNLNSLLAAEKGKETLKSAFDNKEKDQNEAAIHISKETPHEERPGERVLEGGADSEPVPKAAGNQMKKDKLRQESVAIGPGLGDDQPNASQDAVEDVDVQEGGPEPHTRSVEHQDEEFKEELVLRTQNQPRFFSPDEMGLHTDLEGEVPVQGRNLSWQQERDVAAAVTKRMNEKRRLSEGEVKEDTSDKESVHHKAVQGTQEVENRGQTNSAEVLGLHTEESQAEDDDSVPEELLEDENAVSAKQSKEKDTGIQDRRLEVNLQAPERAILETSNPDPETGENKVETGVILEIERKNETVAKGADMLEGGPASIEVEKEESPLVDKKTHRPSEVSDFPYIKKIRTPELGELFQNKDSDDLKEDNPVEQPKTSGFAEKPEVEELSKEDHEDLQKFMGPESQWSASEELEDDLFHWAPHKTMKPEHSDNEKDFPIIRSFFKEQQSLQRFQKYFDVHELEAMFQEMSLKLKSAQQESLPYNVDKVLDKVFRASESHILSVAEKMLDTRVNENKDLGTKENNIFEEAAVLDDIQDLIYFVRYKHSTAEPTVLVAVTRPPEEGWDGPREEIQPPHEDNFPPGSTEDWKMQVAEEPGHLDQPMTSDTAASEVSQTPNTEKDSDPGIITTEGTPVDVKKQLETNAEEPAGATPLEKALLFIYSFVFRVTKTLVATLPDDVRPGPDFYGLPWKPVLITAFLGIVSFAIFFWRTVLAVKSRVYQVSEQEISEKLKNIMKENAELLEKLSNYEQKIKESRKHVQETKKQNMILSDEAIKFKDKIKELEENNEVLDDKAKSLRVMLESEREQNVKNQDLILENKKSIEKLKDVISMNASEFSEVQIALNEAKLSEEKVKSECHRVQEENAKLTKKKEQLQQEIKDWSKLHAELSEQIRSFQKSQKDLEIALTHKDDNIDALTNCITQLNRLDCESQSEDKNKGGSGSDELANGEMGGDRSEKMKNQIRQMMDVSRTKTAISVVEEDLKLLQLKLRASMSTKCNLEDQIKKLEEDRDSLQSTRAELEDECKTLKQKVEILNELYQQKEMALQKKLSQEEYERQEKEQRLSAADEKALLAAEEVKTYRRRIEEMEDELQKTERSFKNQIATHEKKAHDNWLKARAAERAIAEEKREAANLRHKLLEMTQKMAMLQEEPVIIKPMPGRPNTQNPPRRGPLSQNGSFGPSPVSGGECSPPPGDPPVRPLSATLSRREMPRSEFGPMDGPPPRPRWPSEASGKPSAPDTAAGAGPVVNSSPGSSSPKVVDEGKEPEGPSVPGTTSLPEHPVAVNMAAKGPPPFPGMPLTSSPVGGPLPPPIRYGPPPQLCGPFGPRPLPLPFGPGLRPPLGLREYAPGIPPGKRDLPLDPREFLPGHTPFRPLGPREYFISGTRLPPPPHGPQDYPPSPAARDLLPPGSRDEPPSASQSSSQDSSQALKQSP
ncbi:transport and Golgi organization protein 1 homolog isoform X2 [Elephas maximus indicus]|uniref:transport and Golgi organization protein 1 homolog isoform X2 n=1 Tax=Elephas maximus indicus TaxID=99487 RepID=UPI0021170D32|nr:transport and Golgi organization protein 1 homolog isoform X2 [Elephas maximus indicus]